MKFFMKLIFIVSMILGISYANNVSIDQNSYKVLDLEKRAKNIKVTDSKIVEVTFIEDKADPFKKLKVLGKDFGNVSLLITYEDGTIETVDVSVVKNIKSIVAAVQEKYPNVKISQSNDNIIIDGVVDSIPDKEKIKDMFKKAGIDTDNRFIDLATTSNTKKMVRIKLYIAEINNDKGMTLKNNWSVGFKNYHVDDSGTLSRAVKYDYQGANSAQYASYDPAVTDAMSSILAQSVSLTGGLTSTANYLTNKFNVGLTLNYLASQGVATILTESTLLTTEDKAAKFLAGGGASYQKTNAKC